jgi:NADH-quinone oxidoreductase subunit L
MSDLSSYIWLIPALPLLASALIAFFGPRLLRQYSHWPCILSIAFSCVVSVLVFTVVYSATEEGGQPKAFSVSYPWIVAGQVQVPFTLRADALTAMMLVMITFVSTFIAIYSVGYMHGDPGYPRFFAEISLFVFSMVMLVLADNFILLFLGWEGVGLCSYLLIGFWYEKPSAANAARKAFLVTRIGDVGLFLGILVLWLTYGHFDYTHVFDAVADDVRSGKASHTLLLFAALLIFCGAVGKSAQFPLHVWLPDAMEGPTPVSALIHAATMVTAGGYLVARCTPLFMFVPEAQLLVACIGGFTALLAALIALTQNDLKRVLAYSTLSQLGFMFLALGCAVRTPGGALSSDPLVTFAVTAAMFHLFTHAFFKALLFLSAGSVMTAMHHVIDMRRFSGLGQIMPWTRWTFLCGALALSGFPLLSGFWSKDEILAACLHAGETSIHYGSIYFALLAVAVITAGLTAFYTFRAYFMTFHGKLKLPEETHGHAHESPKVMTIPLVVLAVPAVLVGFAIGPTHLFAHFLEHTPGFPKPHPEEPNWMLMGISTVLAVGGIALAWLMYVKQPELPGKLAKAVPSLYQLSLNKFFWDEIYVGLIVAPAERLAALLGKIDLDGIDAFVDLTAQVPRFLGSLFRPVQNGLVQFYALAMVLGLTVFLLALVRAL